MKKERIVIGSDHAGFSIKEYVKKILRLKKYPIEDVGAYSTDSVDYPDYAYAVARKVRRDTTVRGILACSTGIGIAMAANKVPGIRAALVHSVKTARLSREHNNANILVLAGNPFNRDRTKKIVLTWLTTPFHGGRHARRINKITHIEKKYFFKK